MSSSERLNSQPNPLVRREIVIRVGRFLDQRSLLCALLVSHQWHDCLLPLAWAKIKAKYHGSFIKDFDLLQKRRHLVQSLDIVYQKGSDDYGFDLANHYKNLSSLTVLIDPDYTLYYYTDDDEYPSGDGSGNNRLDDVEVIQDHAMSLRYLKLDAQTPSGLLDVLVGCPLLVELHLADQACSPNRWLDLFDTLWSRLRVLSLDVGAPKKQSFYGHRKKMATDIDLAKIVKRLSQARTTKLEELTLTINEEHFPETFIRLYLQLIQRSPKLTRLTWDSRGGGKRASMDYMIGALQSGQLRQPLKSLGMFGDYTNANLEILLTRLTSLQELYLGCSSFDVGSWGILKTRLPRYLTTLTSLEIPRCDGVTGAMVLDMLCSLPNLATFMADYITDLDLLKDTRSWTCGPRMKELRFAFVQTRDDTLPLFLARIAELVQLEIWSLDESWAARRIDKDVGLKESRKSHFQLTLENGLGGLKLQNLKRFRGFSSAARWGEADALWVLEHWVSLDEVFSVSMEEDVRKNLTERYISVSD